MNFEVQDFSLFESEQEYSYRSLFFLHKIRGTCCKHSLTAPWFIIYYLLLLDAQRKQRSKCVVPAQLHLRATPSKEWALLWRDVTSTSTASPSKNHEYLLLLSVKLRGACEAPQLRFQDLQTKHEQTRGGAEAAGGETWPRRDWEAHCKSQYYTTNPQQLHISSL